MKKIIFGSLRNELIQDMEIEHLLGNGGGDYELRLVPSADKLQQEVSNWHPDLIVLDYGMLIQQDAWKLGDIPIAYTARDRDELNRGSSYGMKTVGIGSSASELLVKLGKEPYEIGQQTKTENAKKRVINEERDPAQKPLTEDRKQDPTDSQPPSSLAYGQKQYIEPLDEPEGYDDLYDLDLSSPSADVQSEATPLKTVTDVVQKTGQDPKNNRSEQQKAGDVIEEGFKKDLLHDNGKTRVVTVYSAKGGVGKTTIATELAAYLSLVSIGRRNLRVCLVDYNIDFGDVKGTLALKDEGPNLTYWAEEVQEYLSNGKRPEEIVYDKAGIEEWLRVYKDTGLYVLPAPLTNEDSMGIETEALDIILDNIVKNGGFDFVVCDTGNNTRDSTMIALEHADTILLIMTQNVNTAFCDRAFLETMKSIDFDTSNTKLVINYIMPKKSTGISVQEIVEYFPYECVGKLRFNTDVITATNLGLPLAVNEPDSDFISQMRSIVAFLMKDSEFEVQKKQKKKLFGFLGKR